jgi:sulfane dehydrogenase subunit SoxC
MQLVPNLEASSDGMADDDYNTSLEPEPDVPPGPERRAFLQRTAAGMGTLLAGSVLAGNSAAQEPLPARWPWMLQPGQPLRNYGQPAASESQVVRWISANAVMPGNGISWTPLHELEGIVTPSGLHFERHHNGVPAIDPTVHRLMLHGLLAKPTVFSIQELLRYPMQSRLCFVECGGNSNAGWHDEPVQTPAGYFHGLVSCSEWTGVPLATVMNEVGVRSSARWLIAEGADAVAMNVSLPMRQAVAHGALLALYQNGERIRPENGYPLRLIVPGWEGVLNVKWLRRLKLTDRPEMSRNETAKYTELLPNGRARQFTLVMAVKSLITKPSVGMHLDGPGSYEISGLAWSGHGRIQRVEVSVDAGKTWHRAALQDPVLAQCFTRFRWHWRWNGKPAYLLSRAIDTAGHRQPSRSELLAGRGRYGYFHYNAMVSWGVTADGRIEHVYL